MANNDLTSTGKGALSGGGTGLAIGSNPALLAATGGLSAPIGAAVGAIAGGTVGYVKNKKANQAQDIALTDPLEVNRLARLEQVRKSIASGTDPLTQNALKENAQLNRSVQNVTARNTGGNVSATMDGFLRAQANSQRGINQIQANSQNQVPFYENAASDMASRIAQRRLELGLLKRAQATAENAQAQKENNVNANALISTGQDAFGGNMQNVDLTKLRQFFDNLKANKNQGDQSGMQMPTGAPEQQQVPVTPETFTPEQMATISGISPETMAMLSKIPMAAL